LHLKPELRGKKIRCPKCRHIISLKRNRPNRQQPLQELSDSPESLDWNELADLENRSLGYSDAEYGYAEERPLPMPRSVLGRSSGTGRRGRSLPPGSLANARSIRKQFIRHEVGSIKMIGVLYLVNGVLFLLIAFAVLFIPDEKKITEAQKFLMTLFLLSMGVGLLFTGIKLRTLESWTRIPIAILSGIGVLGFPLGTLVHGWILYLVFSEQGSYIFSDEYKAIVAATPDIQYKSSFQFIVFGILIFIVLIFLSCLGIGLLVNFIGS